MDERRVELARRMMSPNADMQSIQVLASSELLTILLRGDVLYPTHHKGQHHDCTGFYQRSGKKKRKR